MSNEIRVQSEGYFRFVQASGSGNVWATAATPISGRVGYVRSFSYTSGQTIQTVSDRGIPSHHKLTNKQPIEVTINFAWTGIVPTAATAAGASMPMQHLEFMASRPEDGTLPSGYYMQFYGCVLTNQQFTEGDEDTFALTYRALAMNGPTASGYLTV